VKSEPKPVIRPGRRVEYCGQGAFHGARGRVKAVWANGEMATVAIGESTVTKPPEYFEPIQYDD